MLEAGEWRKELVERLKREEGYRRHPYRDPFGKWTIGYGRNLSDVGIDEEEAEWLLERDIDRAVKVAYSVARSHGIALEALPDEVKVVLVDMAFNIGYRLGSFKKMLAAVREGDWEKAAKEMLDSLWARQVGRRAMELANLMRNAGKAAAGAAGGQGEKQHRKHRSRRKRG